MTVTSYAGCDVKTLERNEIPEREWDDFIDQSPQGVHYAKSWYLDVIWPEWQGVMVFYNGTLQAVMPAKISRKWGISYLFNPPFAQYLGIFFNDFSIRHEKALALKKRLTEAIIETLPSLKVFILNFSPAFDYPLPFYWQGFELHTRYSYWLDNQADKKTLFRNCNERTRTYINKARKSQLLASFTDDAAQIINLSRERDAYPLDYNMLQQLWNVLKDKGVGKAVEVRDNTGRLHAGLMYMSSNVKNIHIFSAMDPDMKNLGGMSLAIWHTIEQAGPDVRIHDFEGSMIEPVEKFFRGFGTKPVPYLQLRKNNFPKPFRWLLNR